MTDIAKIKIGDDLRNIKDNDTTYLPVVAGSAVPGLMTGADKEKLDHLVEEYREVTVSTVDIGKGSSLTTGSIYLVYE